MSLHCVPVNPSNRGAFDRLSVAPEQANLIAPNKPWLDLALSVPEALSIGLLKDDTPVGLYTLTDTRGIPPIVLSHHFQQGCCYLWHFMLDKSAQGKGLGKAALAAVETHARRCAAMGLSLTTGDQKPGNALPFYAAAGYVPTGRRIEGEIELIKTFGPKYDA